MLKEFKEFALQGSVVDLAVRTAHLSWSQIRATDTL